MATLKLLAWVAQVSMEQGAIQPKQYEQISLQCWNTQNLLGAWIISDQKRLSSGRQKQEPADQGWPPHRPSQRSDREDPVFRTKAGHGG
jgi:hypothetical protein